LIVTAALVAGCATAQVPRPTPAAESEMAVDAQLRSRASRLTALELTKTGERTTLEAIRRTRPEFLRPSDRATIFDRATLPSVYLNATYAGDIDALNTIPLDVVREILFLHPGEAQSRFGDHCPCGGGVILVRTSLLR
jgi:hypothetical protein